MKETNKFSYFCLKNYTNKKKLKGIHLAHTISTGQNHLQKAQPWSVIKQRESKLYQWNKTPTKNKYIHVLNQNKKVQNTT